MVSFLHVNLIIRGFLPLGIAAGEYKQDRDGFLILHIMGS